MSITLEEKKERHLIASRKWAKAHQEQHKAACKGWHTHIGEHEMSLSAL